MRTGPRWRKGLGTDLKIAGARVNFPAGGKKEGRGGKEGEVGRCVWGAVDVRLKLSFRLRGWRSQSSGDSLWTAKPPLFRGVEESRGCEKREGSVGFSLRRLSPSPGCDRPANWPETPRNRSEKRVQFQVVSFEAREKVWFRRGRKVSFVDPIFLDFRGISKVCSTPENFSMVCLFLDGYAQQYFSINNVRNDGGIGKWWIFIVDSGDDILRALRVRVWKWDGEWNRKFARWNSRLVGLVISGIVYRCWWTTLFGRTKLKVSVVLAYVRENVE